METRQQEPIRRGEVRRCEFCGEDYSVTYKRCPFCDEKPTRNGAGGGSRSSGKRLITNRRGGGYGGGMDPVQVIGLALSIILIIAALYIVYTVVKPLLGKDSKTPPSSSTSQSQQQGSTVKPNPGTSTPKPGSSTTNPGSSTPNPGSSTTNPGSSTTNPGSSTSPGTVTPPSTGGTITFSNITQNDMTLNPDSSWTVKAVLPAGATGPATWTSSNESAATVDQNGTVKNVNQGTKQVTVTITVRAGDASGTFLVRCKPGSSGGSGSSGSSGGSGGSGGSGTTTPDTPTTVPSGKTGTVTGTSSGLLIRSGPGREYKAMATLVNGQVMTILEDTGTGWYRVSYAIGGGQYAEGYASKDYISVN